jgi:Uma2 family endonuclease
MWYNGRKGEIMSDTAVLSRPPAYIIKLPPIPPLESGDHLSRAEFERRYEAMSHVKKAELIEGVVHMPSPVHFLSHSQPHAYIIGWLAVYAAATPGVKLGDNATVRLDADNEVQPDALLRLDEEKGGRSRISRNDYVDGAPELVVEIAASSVSIDLHDKKRVYRRNGVQEYVVWQIYDGRLTWFYLEEGEYKEMTADEQGITRSRVFPGLWLAVEALLADDLATVLAVCQQGILQAGR